MLHCWDADLLWPSQMRSLSCRAARPSPSGLEQPRCPRRQRRARQRSRDQPPQQAQMRRQPFQVSCTADLCPAHTFVQVYCPSMPLKGAHAWTWLRLEPPLHALQMRRAGTRLCCASCRLPLQGLMILTWHPRVSHCWKCTCLRSFRGLLCLLHMPGLAQLRYAQDSAVPKRCCHMARQHPSTVCTALSTPSIKTAACMSCSPSAVLPGVVQQAPQEQPLHPDWPAGHLCKQGRFSAASPGS